MVDRQLHPRQKWKGLMAAATLVFTSMPGLSAESLDTASAPITAPLEGHVTSNHGAVFTAPSIQSLIFDSNGTVEASDQPKSSEPTAHEVPTAALQEPKPATGLKAPRIRFMKETPTLGTIKAAVSMPDFRRSFTGAARVQCHNQPLSHFKLNVPLKGAVSVAVPRTPDDVARYLIHMRFLVSQYERLTITDLVAAGRVQVNPATLLSARQETVNLVNQIDSTVPPAELAQAHRQLAMTMTSVGNFIASPGNLSGGGLQALSQLIPLFQNLHASLNRYHTGVLNCIAFYGLRRSLDPFSGESEQDKQTLESTIGTMKQQLMNPAGQTRGNPLQSLLGGLGNLGNLGAGGLAGLASLLGGAATGSASGGSMLNLLQGTSGGQPGAAGLGSMLNLLQGAPGGQPGAGGLGSMLEQLQGGQGGGADLGQLLQQFGAQ